MHSTYGHKVLNFLTWLASSNHHSSPLVLTRMNQFILLVERKFNTAYTKITVHTAALYANQIHTILELCLTKNISYQVALKALEYY